MRSQASTSGPVQLKFEQAVPQSDRSRVVLQLSDPEAASDAILAQMTFFGPPYRFLSFDERTLRGTPVHPSLHPFVGG